MNCTRHGLVALLVGLAVSWCLTASGSEATVAVLDFAVPLEASSKWAWARGGASDLLQIELERRGLVPLDRGFIQVVLKEKRLALQGSAVGERCSIAAALGAKYLVTGKVLPIGGGRCRVEALAFSVETAETVAAGMGEGELPKELPVILGKVADSLADALAKQSARQSSAPGSEGRPDPEALIAYYKGLDAYAAGYPEIAVAWFLDSAGLDADFAPAQLLEIKAYRAAGRDDHARLREQAIAGLLKRLGMEEAPSNSVSVTTRRSLALMQPVVMPWKDRAAAVDAGLIGTALRQGLIEAGQTRFFDPANIAASLAEQDRVLSGFFSVRGSARYGAWIPADVLLFCRIEEQADDAAVLTLTLCDSTSLSVEAEDHALISGQEASRQVATRTSRLVKSWVLEGEKGGKGAERNRVPTRAEDRLKGVRRQYVRVGSLDLDLYPGEAERLVELPEAHRGLAAGLMGIYRNDHKKIHGSRWHESPEMLAINAFSKLTRFAQAEKTFIEMVNNMDRMSPDTAAILCDIASICDEECTLSQWPWLRTSAYRNRPAERLTECFPGTLWAAAVQLTTAARQWEADNLQQAGSMARESRKGLMKALMDPGLASNMDVLRSVVTDYYIEADAAVCLGRTNDVLQLLSEAEAFIRQHNVPETDLPRRMTIHGSNKTFTTSHWRQDREPGIHAKLLMASLAKGGSPGVAELAEAEGLLALLQAGAQAPTEDEKAVARLIAIYRTFPGNWELADQFLPVVKSGLSSYAKRGGTDRRHVERMQSLVGELSRAMLWGGEEGSVRQTAPTDQGRFEAAAADAIALHEHYGLGEKWVETMKPCFEEPYPPPVGVELLLRGSLSADALKRKMDCLLARLPGEKRSIPFTVWMKYANKLVAECRHGEAWDAYRQAFPAGVPRTFLDINKMVLLCGRVTPDEKSLDELARRACADQQVDPGAPFLQYGLLMSMLDVALEADPGHVDDAMKRLSREIGMDPPDPVAAIWFNIGRRRQAAKRFAEAEICYRRVLALLAPPIVHEKYFLGATQFPWGVDSVQWRQCWTLTSGFSLQGSQTRLAARYWLAKCLIETGGAEEAAEILRSMARDYGDEWVEVYLYQGDYDRMHRVSKMKIGQEALALLKKLHDEHGLPVEIDTGGGHVTVTNEKAK
jgi:tetratricopeptide (TPR) repeat protein